MCDSKKTLAVRFSGLRSSAIIFFFFVAKALGAVTDQYHMIHDPKRDNGNKLRETFVICQSLRPSHVAEDQEQNTVTLIIEVI